MPKIRVLVVDDAVVFRRLVSDELSRDPALEVVGTAANGKIALAKMAQVNPDLVILDVEMPEMDGLQTLAELRKTYPRLPVIMFSALTERGAGRHPGRPRPGGHRLFHQAGACRWARCVARGGPRAAIPKIKALCAAGPHGVATRPGGAQPARASARRSLAAGPLEVVAIACSTGGPNALAEVIPRWPRDFPVPIVIVQHMPPMFTRLLAERLAAQSELRVEEGATGKVLEPGLGWIAPGDHHMVVEAGDQRRLRVHQDPPENSCRPAADVLLRSVAQVYGPNSLAVVMTGMGQDGLRGCEAIRAAGGQIIVQDEATSVVWGMPGYVARAGLADRTLPLSLIADEVLRRVRHGRAG